LQPRFWDSIFCGGFCKLWQITIVTDATLDDLREAVTTLEETTRLARRVLGGAHPTTVWIEGALQGSRAKLLAQGNT